MNFKTTIILLVLLAAAGIAVYFTHESPPPEQATDTQKPTNLYTFSPTDVQQMSVERSDGKKIVLKRDGVNWQMVSPMVATADASIPTEILTDLSGLQSTGRASANGEDGAATGLSPPRFKVELTTNDGKSIKLDVGDKSSTGGQLYIRRDGESQADLVAADVYDQLDKPLSSFRRAKLLDVSTPLVKRLEIDRPDATIVAMKDPTGDKWTLQQPTVMPADATAITDILTGLSSLQMTRVVSDTGSDLRMYGLDHPAIKVSFSTTQPSTAPTTESATRPADTSTTTVSFGMLDLQKKHVYLSTLSNPSVVLVDASSMDLLKKSPLQLRDKQLLNIDPQSISKITIETNLAATTQPTTRPASDSTVTLELRPPAATTTPTTTASTAPSTKPAQSKWLVASTQPAADAVDSKVAGLLSALQPLKVDQFDDSAPLVRLVEDRYTLTVASASERHTIEFSDPGNGQRLIGRYNDLTFELDRAFLDKLKTDYTHPDEASPTPSPSFPPAGGPPGSPAGSLGP